MALLAGALAACGGGDGGDDDEGAASPPTSPDGGEAERMAYVFTFFRGGGGQGVHLAVSTDGLEFREVNEGEPILTSELGEGLTRDPSILLGPEGRWHMVWTSGDLQSIGLSSSDDLLSWDEPRAVPVMEHEPSAINSWAPELHWDATAERYSVV